MKKFLSLFLGLLICITATADPTPPEGYRYIPLDSAKRCVIDHCKLYAPEGDIYHIESVTEYPIYTDDQYWHFFIDPTPRSNWYHRSELVHVSKFLPDSAELSSGYKGGLQMVYPWGWDYTPVKINQIYDPRSDYRPRVIPRTITPEQSEIASHTYAVIINGGCAPQMNFVRFWNDCSFIYQVLTKRYGVPKSNLFPIMSDADDSGPDMLLLNGHQASQSGDLDFDGVDEIKYAATKRNITDVFTTLQKNLKANDHLLVFLTGNVEPPYRDSFITQPDVRLVLWDGEKFSNSDLADCLKPIIDRNVVVNIVAGTGHTNRFAESMDSLNCVITHTGWSEAQASLKVPYTDFLYHWTCAINGATHDNIKVDADSDNDGRVSMSEAYNYANKMMEWTETAMYSSYPQSLGEDLSFDHIPPAADIYIRDNPEDIGHEPNTTTDRTWISPDIWVRNDGTTTPVHENPVYTGPETNIHVLVRIHNRGTQKFTGRKWIHVFAAEASTGFVDETWYGLEVDAYDRATGDHIKGIRIPEIDPGGSVIVKIPWTLPEEFYDPTGETSTHFCIWAEILDSNNYMPGGFVYRDYNVLGRRNQAQKNLILVNKKDAGTAIPVRIRNIISESRKYSLEMVPVTKADEALYSKANIEMEMSPLIGQAWEDGGMLSSNIATTKSANGNHVVRFLDRTSKVEALSLPGREHDYVKLSFKFRQLVLREDQSYTFDLVQRDESGKVIGGERFVVEAPRLTKIDPIKVGTVDKGDGHVELSVDEPGYVRYQWLDETGNEIGTAETVTVRPTVDNTEFEARAFTEEGDVATATVTLEPTAGIKAVSMVAPGSANVELRGAAGRDGRLVVTSMLNNAETVSVPVAEGAGNAEIDMSHMREGIYAVTYMEGGESIETVKFTR